VNAHEPPRAVVFDFNGTISDDEPLLAELCAVIFAEIGIVVSRELYFGEYAGYSDPEIVERVLRSHDRYDPALAERLLGRRTALYLERAASGETVHAAAAACVCEIAARVPVAVASGAARAEVEAVLVGSGLRGLFDVIVAAEDVERGKPDPLAYATALGRLGIPAVGTLAFEDTHLGVEAAVAAGMRCLGVGDTVGGERLMAAGAEAVVASLDWSIPAVRGLFA
jgi:beta-phosphoglucomutase-like phosphatase (HAD superfamily)